MYAMLREELAQDPLLGSETDAARQWVVEVRGAQRALASIGAPVDAHVIENSLKAPCR